MLYPFFYMLHASFQTQAQYQGTKSGLSLSTWSQLFHSQPILRELLNSMMVSTASVVIVVVVATAGGFALAPDQIPGAKPAFLLVSRDVRAAAVDRHPRGTSTSAS